MVFFICCLIHVSSVFLFFSICAGNIPSLKTFTFHATGRDSSSEKDQAPKNKGAQWPMGPARICHSSHDFGWQSSHSVDLAGWQAKMASIEIWILWRSNGPRSVRIRPLRWVLGQGSLLPLSQGEAFTLASISYLAILVKYILAIKKKQAAENHKFSFLAESSQQQPLALSSTLWRYTSVFCIRPFPTFQYSTTWNLR